MAKWMFVYRRADGRQGHVKITADSKPEALKKGMDHAAKSAGIYGSITRFDCKLAQA